MIKAEEKLNEVNSKIETLQSETEKRVNQLNQVVSDLRADIKTAETSQEEADEKTGKFKNEIKLLEGNIADEKKAIEELKAKVAQLDPDLSGKKEKKTELAGNISELESTKSDLDNQIEAKETEKSTLEKEKAEKSVALSDLEASIDKDLEKYQAELDEAKKEYETLLQNNAVWEYLFEQIETPEIEIMAIIAANRGISLDDIKAKATSVSPVFVGRAIAKLEADDKIVKQDEVWDLSPSLIEVIQ